MSESDLKRSRLEYQDIGDKFKEIPLGGDWGWPILDRSVTHFNFRGNYVLEFQISSINPTRNLNVTLFDLLNKKQLPIITGRDRYIDAEYLTTLFSIIESNVEKKKFVEVKDGKRIDISVIRADLRKMLNVVKTIETEWGGNFRINLDP